MDRKTRGINEKMNSLETDKSASLVPGRQIFIRVGVRCFPESSTFWRIKCGVKTLGLGELTDTKFKVKKTCKDLSKPHFIGDNGNMNLCFRQIWYNQPEENFGNEGKKSDARSWEWAWTLRPVVSRRKHEGVWVHARHRTWEYSLGGKRRLYVPPAQVNLCPKWAAR